MQWNWTTYASTGSRDQRGALAFNLLPLLRSTGETTWCITRRAVERFLRDRVDNTLELLQVVFFLVLFLRSLFHWAAKPLIADTSFVLSASSNLSASFSFVSESRKSLLPGPKSTDHKDLAVILTGEQFCIPTNLFEYLYVRIPMDAMLSNQTWLGVLQDNPKRSEEIKSKIHSKMRCITYKLLKELWDDTTY